MSDVLIRVDGLSKVFRLGLWMRKVEAVRSVSFEVRRGDIFGFLGPNGAGKTTTIKMLTGLIAPTAGNATVFDLPVSSSAARRAIGFLPENPYIYPYLTPAEFVDDVRQALRVSTVGACAIARAHVLDQVGILYAADRPVAAFRRAWCSEPGWLRRWSGIPSS